MIILRMAGKILLLPVWLLLATAHLLVKIAVEIYCIGKGLINLILGFMLIGTLLWYRQWERFALLAVAGGILLFFLWLLIMSDTDTTFNFVIAMLQSQLFNLLCDKADDVYGGRLPIHVRVICDEFANTGKIPNMDKLVATIRSREISASIILQSQSQLKTMYQDAADTLVGNCDTTLFLGGKEKSTLKEISEILGKETIDLYNTSETRSNQKSYGLNYQKLGKQLMTEDEIAVMDGGKCILQIRGARPFFSDKYDITKHPNYRYLSDADPKNWFRPEIELNPQYVPKPEEEVEVTEIDLTQESE